MSLMSLMGINTLFGTLFIAIDGTEGRLRVNRISRVYCWFSFAPIFQNTRIEASLRIASLRIASLRIAKLRIANIITLFMAAILLSLTRAKATIKTSFVIFALSRALFLT